MLLNIKTIFKKKTNPKIIKKQIANSYQSQRKENTILNNKIYQNNKKLGKTIREERKKLLANLNENIKNKNLNFLNPIFKKDQSLSERAKRFWKNKQKRNHFIKKAAIWTGAITATTLLCVFFPPAIAPVITGLGVVLGATAVKKLYQISTKRKKEELAFKKILSEKDKKEQKEIEKNKNENTNEFAKQLEKNIKKALEKKQNEFEEAEINNKKEILDEQVKIQKNYIKNIYEKENEEIKELCEKLGNLKKNIATGNTLNKEQLEEVKNCYEKLLHLLKRNGLLQKYMGKISWQHKIQNAASSDTAVLIYLGLLTVGVALLVQKIPKIPSSQTTPWTLLADDFAKQTTQLSYLVTLGNLTSYPDSWRKAVIDIANSTAKDNEPRVINSDNNIKQNPYYRKINKLSADLNFTLSSEEIETIFQQTKGDISNQNKKHQVLQRSTSLPNIHLAYNHKDTTEEMKYRF